MPDDWPLAERLLGEGQEELPEGIKKEVLRPAVAGARRALAGEKVSVHYVGRLGSDGSEFDSSRRQGFPIIFMLSRRDMIKGLVFGLQTMAKGELARFTIEPAYAYGPRGRPEKSIPGDTNLIFEVELLGWPSDSDFFGDGGVLKTVIREGCGKDFPKVDDEVLISLQLRTVDGSMIEAEAQSEYVIGSQKLPQMAKVCDMVLCGMTRGEEIDLQLSGAYAHANTSAEGSIVNLALKEIYCTKTLSLSDSISIIKKRVKEGEGRSMPRDGSMVALGLESVIVDTVALDGFVPRVLEYRLGNGDVCDALELAASDMKKSETAVLTFPASEFHAQLGLLGEASTVQARVKLVAFSYVPEILDMKADEKVQFAAMRKEVGTNLFKQARFKKALQLYQRAIDIVEDLDSFQTVNRGKAQELKKSCQMNKAVCHLRLEEFRAALSACEAVLDWSGHDVKAVYRRAQAYFGLGELPACVLDCKRVLEVEPQSRDARALLKQALAQKKQDHKLSAGLFSDMCKALGKGPIPEPHRQEPDELPDGAIFQDE